MSPSLSPSIKNEGGFVAVAKTGVMAYSEKNVTSVNAKSERRNERLQPEPLPPLLMGDFMVFTPFQSL